MFNFLIVDDELHVRQGLSKIISNIEDCHVSDIASNGNEAISKIKQHGNIDIVITDIKMPDMNGLEFCKHISTNFPNIKIIILTGYPLFDYAKQAIKYRVIEFLLKPTDMAELHKAIQKAKELKHTNKEPKIGKFLANLYYGSLSDKQISEQVLEHNLNTDKLVTAILAVENEEQIKDLLSLLSNSHIVNFIEIHENQVYALINEAQINDIEILIKENNLSEHFSANVGFSSTFNDIKSFKRTIQEATYALKFAYYDENHPVTRYIDIPQTDTSVLEECMKYLQQLKVAIETHDKNLSSSTCTNLFSYIKKQKIPYDEVSKICTLIYNFCISTLYNYSLVSSMDKNNIINIENILKSLDIERTEEEIKQFIINVISFTGENPTYVDNIVNTIKAYIDINYKNDISLDVLSKKAHFSPSYLSKLFKKEIGENISTYIQAVRINHAKTMLKTTSMKTYEIAEAVGIDDPVYFSRIFKRITGMKPKEYRDND